MGKTPRKRKRDTKKEPEPKEEEVDEEEEFDDDDPDDPQADDTVPGEPTNTIVSSEIFIDTEESNALKQINEEYVNSLQLLMELRNRDILDTFVYMHTRNCIEVRMIRKLCEMFGADPDYYRLFLEVMEAPLPFMDVEDEDMGAMDEEDGFQPPRPPSDEDQALAALFGEDVDEFFS